MIPQFNNNALASFFFWSENELLSKTLAYKNYTSRLYYMDDERLPNHVTYSSPFKQWNYNSAISGSNIASGISGSITLSNNQSGMQIDYDNGRVILPASFGKNLNISGSYSFKEINFYLADETEEKLLISNKAYLNSRFVKQIPSSGIAPYDQVAPAIFVNLANNHTEGLALGGLKNSEINISMVVMVETMSQLDAVLGTFADSKEKYFPQLSVYDDPINEYGNIKTGIYPNGYNYNDIIVQKGQPGNLFFIKDVWTSKISDRIQINEDIFAGVIDITISRIRTT